MQRILFLLLTTAALAGCADMAKAPQGDYASVTAESEMAPAMPPSPPAGMLGRESGAAFKMSAPSRARPRKGRGPAAEPPMDGEATRPAATPRPKRMVHYNGYLKLRVSNPTQTLQHASEIADAAGGYVENLTATTVTVRVPVAKFRVVFSKLAKIGEVLSRSMTAQDVTDALAAA